MATSNPTPISGDIPIIDSHIHLFPSSELETLAWNSPSNKLCSQHAVPEYLSSVNGPARPEIKPSLRGFIVVESDRKTDLHDPEAWDSGPLKELRYLINIANGSLSEKDGHHTAGSGLLLGIVPWAPIPSGVEVLKDYISRAKEIAGDKWDLVKGFRYLVQDQPPKTMLQADFIASLKYLGEQGLVFDLGVDYHSGGASQLDEAVEMLRLVTEDTSVEKQVKVVVNHMCKPPIDADGHSEAAVEDWFEKIGAIAEFGNTVVKISGRFSEIKPLPKDGTVDQGEAERMMENTKTEIGEFIALSIHAFGIDRAMFASDWPICNTGGGGSKTAWKDWLATVLAAPGVKELSREEQEKLFWKTAQHAYNVKSKRF